MEQNRYRFFQLPFQLLFFGGILLFGTILFRTTNLDFLLSDPWYQADRLPRWPAQEHPFWEFIYTYGVLPNIFLFVAAIIVYIRTFLKPGRYRQRKKALCIMLAIFLGPALIVNTILKPHYNRPRPYDVDRYGGKYEFHKILTPSKEGASFPSGHVSAGFALTILFYVNYLRRRKLAWLLWWGAMILGGLLTITRVTQGGHFASDALWAFGITQIVNSICCFFVFNIPKLERDPPKLFFKKPGKVKIWLINGTTVFLPAFFLFAFLLNTPLSYHEMIRTPLPEGMERVIIKSDFEDEKIFLAEGDQREITIDYLVLAHGVPTGIAFIPHTELTKDGKTGTFKIWITKKGLLKEYRGRLKIFFPKGVEVINQLKTKRGSIRKISPKK